ncbi:shikimate kinase [Hymenobacter sp. BT664]|uniref:Shikimate kinase n=1 Tax=Hymenobacter montanus TaxID=2771359 RepID=A0A927BBI4_9BACT|nr:shikimate kinase [Hymenobacter montanus]MBD2766978.1 shikimate kinase [Hymenobacter montanus]
MKLFLIGMPGSGKTTLGRTLAAHYGLPFLDLDAEIVARGGQAIPAIFLRQGEAYFRRLEAKVLREVAARPGPLVLATGGGTPCFHDNLTVLNAAGCTLWLDVPEPVLAARLAAATETATRPLVATADRPEQWLHETLAARKQFYSQARVRCRGTACTVAAVVARLAAAGFTPTPRGELPPDA